MIAGKKMISDVVQLVEIWPFKKFRSNSCYILKNGESDYENDIWSYGVQRAEIWSFEKFMIDIPSDNEPRVASQRKQQYTVTMKQ